MTNTTSNQSALTIWVRKNWLVMAALAWLILLTIVFLKYRLTYIFESNIIQISVATAAGLFSLTKGIAYYKKQRFRPRGTSFLWITVHFAQMILPMVALIIICASVNPNCEQDRFMTRDITQELTDSTDHYLPRILTFQAIEENCHSINGKVKSYQQDLLSRLMDKHAVPKQCRTQYLALSDSITESYSSFICRQFALRDQLRNELNELIQNKDIPGIIYFLERHNIPAEAKAVEFTNNKILVSRGILKHYLIDIIQGLEPATTFKVVWDMRDQFKNNTISDIIFIKI